jgi:hypothetical protein
MLRTSVTGLQDNREQWITFESWYPAYLGGQVIDRNWMVWENLVIEYTPVGPAAVPGDFDSDKDVDQKDFGHLQACYSGAGTAPNDPGCDDADLDNDEDVDLDDFSILQSCMSGDDIPADPHCAD